MLIFGVMENSIEATAVWRVEHVGAYFTTNNGKPKGKTWNMKWQGLYVLLKYKRA